MKNFIQTIIERRNAKDAQLAKENQMRKERLAQLEEELKSKKGFNILHPIQSKKIKKEIDQLRNEISEYDRRKEKSKSQWQMIGLCALGFGFLIIALISEKISGSKDNGSTSAVSEQVIVEITENVVENREGNMSTEIISVMTTEATTYYSKETEENKTKNSETEPITEESTEKASLVEEKMDLDIPMFTVNNMNVVYENDYYHFSMDTIKLGNDEGVTVTVEAQRKDIGEEDILVVYDEELISVHSEEPYVQNNKMYFTYYITGNTECSTEVGFFTRYDYLTKGEDLEGYILDIKKCNSEDGRVCYVTNTGDKYHYSVDCAGASATKTIYWDVKSYDYYQPCGKCAN